MFAKVKIWGAATVGSKGQVVIPAEAREALDIKEGAKLIVVGNPARKGVAFVKAEVIENKLLDIQTGLTEVQKLTNDKGYETT
jgi:AbrB family looped-hinge helix DNA binding protein